MITQRETIEENNRTIERASRAEKRVRLRSAWRNTSLTLGVEKRKKERIVFSVSWYLCGECPTGIGALRRLPPSGST
jgi:hypothetical protein